MGHRVHNCKGGPSIHVSVLVHQYWCIEGCMQGDASAGCVKAKDHRLRIHTSLDRVSEHETWSFLDQTITLHV